ncbi:MAG TPA: T9SS type A sorting domain-containing protein [Ignavibacteria bacterium]
MKRLNLLFFLLVIPVFTFSQYVLKKNWHVSALIKNSTVQRTDSVGAWIVKGGYDVNKNGKKEILIMTDPTVSGGKTTDTTNTLFLLENDGNDNYKLIWSYKSPYPVNSYGDVEVADMDQDGKPEIWFTFPTIVNNNRPNPPRIMCFEFDGTNIPTTPTLEWNFNVRDNFDMRPSCIVFDDVDNDGTVELICTTRKDDYTGSGAGRTLLVASSPLPIEAGGLNLLQVEFIDTSSYLKGGAIYEAKVLDYDRDGKKEIWVFTWDQYTVNIYEATGADKYNHEVEIRKAVPESDIGSFMATHFYDANKDGKLEGFVAGAQGDFGTGDVLYIESCDDVSKLTKNNIKEIGYRIGSNPRGAAIGDFDKNGLMDFVFVDRKLNKVVKMEYKGTGSLADSTSYKWSDLMVDTSTTYLPDYFMMSAASSDLDGDGFQELLIANLDVMHPSKPLVIVLEATKVNSVEKKEGVIPSEFSLGQNYPNPFNPTTNIEFAIPKSAKVSLKVYNMLGQEMATLVNETKEAGKYVVTFNSGNLPSGTYYYKLSADNYSEVKKMMLMK